MNQEAETETGAGAGYKQVKTGLDTDADLSVWKRHLILVIAWQQITQTQMALGTIGGMREHWWWRSSWQTETFRDNCWATGMASLKEV